MREPPVVIVSGPSGSGKSTVIARLLAEGGLPMHLSVSATTRRPRAGERDGVHYHFWSPVRFAEEERAGAFLETAEVHGNRYGTLRREVEPYRRAGQLVLLEVDVQGAATLRRVVPEHVTVFVKAPSFEAYEERLRARGTEDEAEIRRRLEAVRRELARAGEYQHEIVNDDVGAAVARIRSVLQSCWQGDAHAGRAEGRADCQ